MYDHIPLVGLYIIVVLWVICFAFVFHRHITSMAGMVAAMGIGMTSGLGIGMVLGIAQGEYFLQAIIMGTLVGMIFGLLAGSPFGLAAIVDGISSGIMGGMMGAMTGAMIPPEHGLSLIKIIFVLSMGMYFIIYLLLHQEADLHKSRSELTGWVKSMLSKPSLLFIIVCIFLIQIYQMEGTKVKHELDDAPHPSHSMVVEEGP
ncbi:hypothetical protein HUR95_13075 [Caldalkalibacillus thermarum TA2.A1]|uniref:Uncharacterized protein n=1 Tax=Caldalkalibacillus thermarum (strain TA2.A1) TaxID=986075 RepID=A0A8X8L9U1_CALTT|nr:hypothetical protein [Caldalkalibacillus thermarum]QZT33218.1 hypothetical protein HUR95_13075 [Caldalkalibacillus thermarum TA2.A1]